MSSGWKSRLRKSPASTSGIVSPVYSSTARLAYRTPPSGLRTTMDSAMASRISANSRVEVLINQIYATMAHAEDGDMVTWGRRMSGARKRIGRRLADPRELAVVRMMERLGLAAHDQCGVFVIRPGVVRLDHHPDPERQGFEGFLEKRIRADPVRRHSTLGG